MEARDITSSETLVMIAKIKGDSMKDWVGDTHSVFNTLGASNHSDTERESNDYYATDPLAIDYLLNKLSLLWITQWTMWIKLKRGYKSMEIFKNTRAALDKIEKLETELEECNSWDSYQKELDSIDRAILDQPMTYLALMICQDSEQIGMDLGTILHAFKETRFKL